MRPGPKIRRKRRNVHQQEKRGKGGTAPAPARPAAAAAAEPSLPRPNRNAPSAPSALTRRAPAPALHTKILPEMSVKKAKGRHLAPGHPKDQEDHDPDPLKSQGKNPGLSPVLLTDLTRSQRKANTDNVNIFYDAVTYWKCGFVFVPEQSV